MITDQQEAEIKFVKGNIDVALRVVMQAYDERKGLSFKYSPVEEAGYEALRRFLDERNMKRRV